MADIEHVSDIPALKAELAKLDIGGKVLTDPIGDGSSRTYLNCLRYAPIFRYADVKEILDIISEKVSFLEAYEALSSKHDVLIHMINAYKGKEDMKAALEGDGPYQADMPLYLKLLADYPTSVLGRQQELELIKLFVEIGVDFSVEGKESSEGAAALEAHTVSGVETYAFAMANKENPYGAAVLKEISKTTGFGAVFNAVLRYHDGALTALEAYLGREGVKEFLETTSSRQEGGLGIIVTCANYKHLLRSMDSGDHNENLIDTIQVLAQIGVDFSATDAELSN